MLGKGLNGGSRLLSFKFRWSNCSHVRVVLLCSSCVPNGSVSLIFQYFSFLIPKKDLLQFSNLIRRDPFETRFVPLASSRLVYIRISITPTFFLHLSSIFFSQYFSQQLRVYDNFVSFLRKISSVFFSQQTEERPVNAHRLQITMSTVSYGKCI